MSWTNNSEKPTIWAKMLCTESVGKDHNCYFFKLEQSPISCTWILWGWKWSKRRISEIHSNGRFRWLNCISFSLLKETKWCQEKHHLSPYLVLLLSPCSLQLRYICSCDWYKCFSTPVVSYVTQIKKKKKKVDTQIRKLCCF